MNERTSIALNNIITELRKKPENFSPIRINIDKFYYSSLFGDLVKEVSDDIDNILSQHKELFANIRLEDKSRLFQITLKSFLNCGKKISDYQDILKQRFDISVSEDDFGRALNNPKVYIKSKKDYKKDEEIEKLILERESIFDCIQSDNINYTKNKKAFIVADMLLNNELKKFFNPIENISNNYSSLKEFLIQKNIDLMKDSDFSSYNLISINQNVELMNIFPPRLYHNIADVTIFTNGISENVFKVLLDLQKVNKFKLSLKPSSIFFYDGKYEVEKLEEHLETGIYFHPRNFKAKPLTKLYDQNYNTLWIKNNGKDLTFEELLTDYKIYDDYIFTQVVHCQYYIDKNKDLYITHIDHEFIFYTPSEYEQRQKDANQKGSAQKRIKTFKIDDAKIEIKDEYNALYNLLILLFDNKDLIIEYFNENRK